MRDTQNEFNATIQEKKERTITSSQDHYCLGMKILQKRN